MTTGKSVNEIAYAALVEVGYADPNRPMFMRKDTPPDVALRACNLGRSSKGLPPFASAEEVVTRALKRWRDDPRQTAIWRRWAERWGIEVPS